MATSSNGERSPHRSVGRKRSHTAANPSDQKMSAVPSVNGLARPKI